MVYSSWRRPPRKDNNLVVKLGFSLLLLGLAFVLLYSRPTKFSPGPQISSSLVSLVESQENEDDIPTQEHSTKNGEKCDLFMGDWVPYHEEPLYNMSCSFVFEYQNCVNNGRLDKDYLYWRWKPRGCGLPRFDPLRFLEMMRNRSWAFIGDSISRNHFESFMCILTTVEKGVMVYHNEDYKSQKWVIPSYNFSASIVWSPFLAKASIPKDVYDVSPSEIDLHLDILDTNWTNQYKTWDYMIFSAARWFSKGAIYYENNTILGCHYCPTRNSTKELGLDFAYRKVLRSVLDYITESSHKGKVFYRTTTPDHFESGEWNGGSCKRRVPAKEGEFELSWLDKTLRNIELEELEKVSVKGSDNGAKLRVLDVNPMALLRPDAHPDVYRFYQPFGEDKNAKVTSDCLHWCLPGPIDTWNDLLMEMVLHG